MRYYSDVIILIRNMEEPDAQIIADEEIAQGWHSSVILNRLAEHLRTRAGLKS